MNIFTRAWLWLITKETKETKMSEPVNDGTTVDHATVDLAPVVDVQTVNENPTPAQEVKTGVQDFEKAFSFVEQGIAILGEAAKDELKSLVTKYL
jgi:hypothetical protein